MQLRYYVDDVVYGANDGIVTTFAIIAGVIGAGLSAQVIVIVGLASLIADAFSMATSGYLAQKSEREMSLSLGIDPAVCPPIDKNPVRGGWITFLAFIAAGAVPLIPFIVFNDSANTVLYASLAALVTLFFVGSVRTYATGESFIRGGMEMVIIGGIAAVIAFVIGQMIAGFVG